MSDRWHKYSDRPNLRRALGIADEAVAVSLFRIEYTGRQRYEHKVVLGTAPRRAPHTGSGFDAPRLTRYMRRFDAMTKALTEAGILFTWERTGRIRVLDGEELRALNASAKAGKARQLASGAVYTEQFVGDADLDESKPWSEVHSVKLDVLRDLVEEAQGEPILCFYWYQHELTRLQREFPKARLATDQDALDAWDRREVPLLLAHPMSAGHGLNLQAGGSTIVWLTLPYSHELWEQGNGRCVRLGQRSPFVTIIALCCGDFDRAVFSALQEKGATQDALMQHVELDVDDPILD